MSDREEKEPRADGKTRRYPLSAVEALFHGALERPAGPTRSRWLHHAAGGDTILVEEVADLLKAHVASTEFLERGPLLTLDPIDDASEEAAATEPPEELGRTIGAYTLVEALGEGGFGVVYRAEQSAPVRREVALKIIKLGMDTRQVIARFEAERQALALLDHPSIARVLDAGATESGRPFFVMDLVPGVDLTEFCDGESLDIRARCEVFLDLCAAVQHAHQRGIIHRDLKPSNILVARTDNRVIPKVIDFGISKATTADIQSAETMRTEMGQIIGTPVYMSPEQALGQSDIDTRTDVYALGVILYELLSGTTPISSSMLLEKARAGELGSFLADFSPPSPSSRISSVTDGHVKARGGSPAEVRSCVRGDLDAITLHALEPERERRYESAAALARDVRRFMENRPIEAAAPSALYRSQKFLRRHRIAAIAGSAVLGALLTGAAVAVDSARARRNQATVLSGVFSAAHAVDPNAVGKPFGSSDLGDQTAAVDNLEKRAVEAFGEDDPIIIEALSTLANRLERSGSLEEALIARRRALYRATSVHSERSQPVILASNEVGLQLARMGKVDEAKKHLRRAVERDTELNPPGMPFLNTARLELARLLADEGDLGSAERLASTADTVARRRASKDQRTREDSLRALVDIRKRAGNDDGARSAWGDLFSVLGQSASRTSTALPEERMRFGHWLAGGGRSEEAALVLRDAIDVLRTLDGDHDVLEFEALVAFGAVAVDAVGAGSIPLDRAHSELARELDLARQLFRPGSTRHTEALRRIANHHAAWGNVGDEIERLIELYTSLEQTLPEGSERDAQLTQIARELGQRATNARVTEGLEASAYTLASNAVAIGLAHHPNNTSFMVSQIELEVRYGRPVRLFRQIESLRSAANLEGDHPLFLALEAVAYAQTRAHLGKAQDRLLRARQLSGQFLGTPNLNETIEWAAGEVAAAEGRSEEAESTSRDD